MTPNQKAASPVLADHQGETASQNQDHHTTFSPKSLLHRWPSVLPIILSIIWQMILATISWGGKAMIKTTQRELTPRQQRIVNALTEIPKGLLSFDLRKKCGCMNIADEVMAMRRLGFNITCKLEPYTTEDGVKSKIGRYRLVSQGGEI